MKTRVYCNANITIIKKYITVILQAIKGRLFRKMATILSMQNDY